MGNENTIGLATSPIPQPIENLEPTHLGPVTLMQLADQFCLLKIFSYSDAFLMEDRHRKLKTRTSKLANNAHVLNIHQVLKQERKELCTNNYQLITYLQKYDETLAQAINRRLYTRKNYTEEELYLFLAKVVESLLYIQDNGLKNIQLDAESILFCKEQVKILDTGLACSKTYLKLLQHREKSLKCQASVYLAPQLLKELSDLNYDPYISPKADIFSLGMLVLQMVALQPMQGYYDYPNASIDYDSLIHRLSRITHTLPLKTLLAEMLEYDPQQRIGLLSLKEKIQRLRNPNQQGITRSKSSKMLQEILSHSRRSSSICKQSQQSISMSRQPSSEKKMLKKIQLRCSIKREPQVLRPETQPCASPFTTRREPYTSNRDDMQKEQIQTQYNQHNLKDLVKNKLNRDKGKAKQNSSKLLRPIRKQTAIFPSSKTALQPRPNQQQNINILQSSLQSKKFGISFKSRQSQSGVKATLTKLVQQSGMKKLLRLQQLDVGSQKRSQNGSQNDSLRNTSRFGSHPHTQQEVKYKTSRVAQIYIQQQKQQEYNLQIDEFRHSNQPQPQKTLHKVMTFNKQILINAKSVQQSLEYTTLAFKDRSRSNLAFSPITSHQYNQNTSIQTESAYKNITIKDVPIIISTEKIYQGQIPPPSFGNLQRHLNLMESAESLRQGSSLASSFNNNNSKVIQSYRPNEEDYLSAKIQPLPYELSAPFKKPKSKKPQLMIRLEQDEQNQSPSTSNLPMTLQPSKSNLQHLYKTTKSIEHLSNFTSISPPELQKQNPPNLNYLQRGFSPELQEQFTNKLTLPNGKQYEGDILGQLPHGNGVLYTNGKVAFSGSFKFGQYHGFGTLHNPDYYPQPVDHKFIDLTRNYWQRFEGEWDEGLMNGFGTLFFAQGEKFSGCLKQGVIQGYGCFYRKNGELISGLWSQNRFRKV